jgi:endonuclease YncB( thermonuclease family)
MARNPLRVGAATLSLAAALLLLGVLVNPTARGEPIAASGQAVHWRVIDGDTFEDLDTRDRYRLENIDTPETGPRASCSAERELGDRATQRARAFITTAARLEVRRTGRVDRYDRIIAFVSVDGRDLGELMIAEGLARPWRGRREPWCDAGGNLIP